MSPRIGSYVQDLTIHLEVGHQGRFTTLNAVLRKVRRLTMLTLLAAICVLSTLRSLCLTRLAGVHASFILQAPSAVRAVSLSRISVRDKSTSRPHGVATANIEELVLMAQVDFGCDGNRYKSVLDHYPCCSSSFPALRFLKTLDFLLSELLAGASLLQTLFLKVDLLSNPGSNWPAHVPIHPLFSSASQVKQVFPCLREVHCSRNKLVGPECCFGAYVMQKFAGAEAGILTCSRYFVLIERGFDSSVW
ncbi:hypothetical protein DFH09DRAFT_1327648 [Mycena vulgaris]|nr:hypothetical protein DFH09DRAFT_1327648 [Mycena vulgaris]